VRRQRRGYLHIIKIITQRPDGKTGKIYAGVVAPTKFFPEDVIREYGEIKGFATKLESFKPPFETLGMFRKAFPYKGGPWEVIFETEPGVSESGRSVTFLWNILVLSKG